MSKSSSTSSSSSSPSLSFQFRGNRTVPVTYHPSVGRDAAAEAIESEPFRKWVENASRTRDAKGDDPNKGGVMGNNNDNGGRAESALLSLSSGRRSLDVRSVEIQNVDMFGPRYAAAAAAVIVGVGLRDGQVDGLWGEKKGGRIGNLFMAWCCWVGFVKIKADCSLRHDEGDCAGGNEGKGSGTDGGVNYNSREPDHRLPGICLLRGDSVGILVELRCVDNDNDDESNDDNNYDDGGTYSLLVEQPRVPIGETSTLELPAGMIDSDNGAVRGVAAKEMKEECGLDVRESDLIDLTALAYGGCSSSSSSSSLCSSFPGIYPSPGGCDESIRLMYLEKTVSRSELNEMKNRLGGLREEGEIIVLRVVRMRDVWRLTSDAKALCALFLLNQLRSSGAIPPPKPMRRRFVPPEPTLTMNNGRAIPRLAFGLYKVSANECESVVADAVRAGYRHFDTASYYGNEAALGDALRKCGVPRDELFVSTKVWNDAQRGGRSAVRESVERSLADIGLGYIDLVLVHWPVPGYHVDTYKELELLLQEGKVRSIGVSNYSEEDYNELMDGGARITPVVNQMEVSPAMYRPGTIRFFADRGVVVGASKAVNRGESFELKPIKDLAEKHSVSQAQIMIRWALQRGLVPVVKTSHRSRMRENRSVFHFVLDGKDLSFLDAITTEDVVSQRKDLEAKRKTQM